MLDINLIREKPEEVRAALLKRIDDVDFTELLQWDERRRKLIPEIGELRQKRNEVSSQIPALKKEGKDISPIQAEMRSVGERIKDLETDLSTVEASIRDFLVALPNIPADDVPAGGKENNEVIRVWGNKPEFDFELKGHIALAKSLNLIDYERGVKMGGNGFWLYCGDGAKLEWALLNYFVEEHFEDGYEMILPPHILTYQCGFTAGQFPKFTDDVFHLLPDDGGESTQFLLPTSETALINLYRDEVVPESELPKKFFSYTPCYRKEAGSYRTNERGMIRGHQFNKVEMFQFTIPEDSPKALNELVEKAERLVQGLGLHYRVSNLAAQDCSASMTKTFDIEVWIPSMGEYKEISSASNANDYQARRGNIRFKRKATGRNEYLHTLNASGLATSRLLPAIVEQFQRPDGSITVPDVLAERFGKSKIRPT